MSFLIASIASLRAQAAKEGANVGGHQFRFLCGRKMAASWHVRPAPDVVASLKPLPWRKDNLIRKASDGARGMEKFIRCKLKRCPSTFIIHAERRRDGLSQPVERDICQKFIPRKAAVKIAATVRPLPKLFQYPCSQTTRRVIQRVGWSLRSCSLKVRVRPVLVKPT